MRLNLWRVSVIAFAALLGAALLGASQQSKNQTSTGPAAKSQTPSTSTSGAMKVDLDELEKHPEKYIGKMVTTQGEVDRVLGINLFTVDEQNWVDLDRELPVVVPDGFTAVLTPDAPVKVTGTIERVPIAKIERRGQITDATIRAEIAKQPALLATEILSASPAVAVVDLLIKEPPKTEGAAGARSGSPKAK